MFAKRTKPTEPPPRPNDDASQTVQSGPDPRDATIERLARELAAERANLTTVREALDAATFKIQVLEKSYAKQLADTRQRLATHESSLAEKQQVLAGLDGGHEGALRALSDTRAELKLVTAERDQLRTQMAGGGFKQRSAAATRRPLTMAPDESADSGGTINELISNAGWAPNKPAARSGHTAAEVAKPDPPPEDMLAPELVFTKGKNDD